MLGLRQVPFAPRGGIGARPSGPMMRPVGIRGRRLGQAGVLSVAVMVDGQPAPDVPVEVLFADGSDEMGNTGGDGLFAAPYGDQQYGSAIVRIDQPVGTVDLGEEAAKPVELGEGAASVAFELESIAAAGNGANGAPAPGLSRTTQGLVGLGAALAMVFLGVSAS